MEQSYQQIVEAILKILSEKIVVETPHDGKMAADTPLLSSGVTLDSVAVLQLLMEIEDHFGVEFSDEDLTVELFQNVGSLATAVEQKLRV
jgi:acyl carrier protein